MKKTKSILLTLAGTLLLTACHGGNPSSEESQSNKKETTPEEIINNFFHQIQGSNYSIESPDFYTADVFSKDLVHLDFDGYDDYFMSFNGNELYSLALDDGNQFDDHNIKFLGKGRAVEAKDAFPYLLDSWGYYVSDNLWDTFTTHADDPLRFTIDKASLGGHIVEYVASIPGAYKGSVDTIDLILNQENPTAASIEIDFTDESVPMKKVDIKFGIEKKDLVVDAWLNNENRPYPETQEGWVNEDAVAFDAVYNQTLEHAMNEAIPFPSEFKTRTFYRYPNYFGDAPTFFITDTLATKEGYEKYVSNLVGKYGFEKHQEMIDGVLVDRYDKLLYTYRDIYLTYSSIYIEFTSEGVSMKAEQTYNPITFKGRDGVNSFLEKMHFQTFPQADFLTSFIAYDDTLEQSESYTFLTPYTRSLRVEVAHHDINQSEAYLNQYYEDLEKQGFVRSPNSPFISKEEEGYSSRMTCGLSEDTIYFEFWYMEYMKDDDVLAWMNRYGFPTIDVKTLYATAKDATKYYQYDALVYQKDILALDVVFHSVDERNNYRTSFVLNLINNEGFVEWDNPHKLKIARRDTAFYNASKGLIIAYDDNATNAFVDFHLIKVADDFEPLP